MIREVTEQLPRVRSLMGDLGEDPVNGKVVSAMYLSLGEAARRQIIDSIPHTILWALKASVLIQMCTDCFLKKRNKTLDNHQSFSRMQEPGETLYEFRHALNSLAPKCDFRETTTTLALDMSILHMNKKKVQENFCTKPREPEQALDYATAFKEGVKRQKSCRGEN